MEAKPDHSAAMMALRIRTRSTSGVAITDGSESRIRSRTEPRPANISSSPVAEPTEVDKAIL